MGHLICGTDGGASRNTFRVWSMRVICDSICNDIERGNVKSSYTSLIFIIQLQQITGR